MDDASPRNRAARWLGPVLSFAASAVTLTVLCVALPRIMPGDPLSALWTEGAREYVYDDVERAALLASYGGDQPLAQQVAGELGGLSRGDLGVSIHHDEPVAGLLGERIPRSALLVGTAMVLGVAFGAAGGAVAGWRRGGPIDRSGLAVVTLVRATPTFFLAALAMYVFAVHLSWFPVSGHASSFRDPDAGLLAVAGDVLHHVVLPAGVLAATVAAGQFLVMRASMLTQRRARHLLGARARGASEGQVLRRHAARGAAPPAVALAGIQAGAVVTGAMVVETVFAYPGLGELLVDAVTHRDYPVMQGAFLTLTLTVLAANLAADLALRRLDPRVGVP
ncbi:MAG: ABC transporter permease [Dermatophilaceae bacterium]